MSESLPDLSVRQLEYLTAVVDAPTWAVAAEQVGVTPSAMSQGLAELERRLGVSVFRREGRRKVLVDDAAPVVEHARRVLALSGDLARWARRHREGETGAVRVGMIDVAALVHRSAALARIRRERPDLELALRVAPTGELVEQLRAGELDMIIGVRTDPPPPGIVWTDLLTEPLALYAPAGVPVGPASTWGPFVLFPTSSRTRGLIEAELRRLGATVRVVAESNQPDVLRQMVQLGLGWTVLPEVQAERGGDPLRRAMEDPVAVRRLGLGRRDDASPSPAVEAVIEELLADGAATADP